MFITIPYADCLWSGFAGMYDGKHVVPLLLSIPLDSDHSLMTTIACRNVSRHWGRSPVRSDFKIKCNPRVQTMYCLGFLFIFVFSTKVSNQAYRSLNDLQLSVSRGMIIIFLQLSWVFNWTWMIVASEIKGCNTFWDKIFSSISPVRSSIFPFLSSKITCTSLFFVCDLQLDNWIFTKGIQRRSLLLHTVRVKIFPSLLT